MRLLLRQVTENIHSLVTILLIKMRLYNELEDLSPLIIDFEKMFESLLIRIVSLSLGFILILCPTSLQASEIFTTSHDLEPSEIVEVPDQMTQKQMNDLFGEDPYLGQTSYLQSPEGYSQREN